MAISAITGLISATGAAIAAGGMAIGAFIKTAVAFTALGAVSRALLAPSGEIPTLNTGGAGGTTVSVKNSVATRRLIYGKTRVGGTIVYSGSSGDDNEYLWQAYALADTAYKTTSAPYNPTPALNDLVSVYFDDELIATYSGGTFTFQPDWRLSDVQTNVSPYVSIYFYDGSQTINAGIDHSEWTSDHELRGIAYVAIRFVYDQDRYINGVPNVSFVVEGRKVYDPRKDSTSSYYDSSLGVSSHREDNPVTWQFSENPVLCLLDYMRDPVYGLGEPMSSFVKLGLAIDDCEDNVDLSSSIQNVPRYKCGGVIDSGNKIATNIENILSSMAGKLYYSQGRYRIKPLVDTTVAQATVITEDMMIGAVKLATRTSRRNQYNIVKGKFNDEDANYIATDYPAKTISTYKTADGADLVLDVDLPLTTNQHRAQAIAYSLLKKSRNQATINLRLNLSAYRYDIGDIVKVTYSKFGYVEKTFEIQHLQLIPDPELGIYVDITAVEDDPSQYTYDTSTAVTRITPSLIHVTQGRTVKTPDEIHASVIIRADDFGNITPELQITLDDDPDPFMKHYQFHVYKIPSLGATGHEQYIATGIEFNVDRLLSDRGSHTIYLPFADVGVYRVTCEAVNIQDRHSSTAISEYTITESDRETLVSAPETANFYLIRQTATLTQPTVEQMRLAKGGTPAHNDEYIYQQVVNGIVLESRVLTYQTSMNIQMIHNHSSIYGQDKNRCLVYAVVAVRIDKDNTSSLVWSATAQGSKLIAGSNGYNWSERGTITVHYTDSEIDQLADSSNGIYALPQAGADWIKNENSGEIWRYAVIKFEVDSQYVDDSGTQLIGNTFEFRLTHGSDVYVKDADVKAQIINN